jgi:hypothetical protein
MVIEKKVPGFRINHSGSTTLSALMGGRGFLLHRDTAEVI